MNAKKLLMTAAVVMGICAAFVPSAIATYMVNTEGTYLGYTSDNTINGEYLGAAWLYKATPGNTVSEDGPYASYFDAAFSNGGKDVTIKWGDALVPPGTLPVNMGQPELKLFALKAGNGYVVWNISTFDYSDPDIFATTVGVHVWVQKNNGTWQDVFGDKAISHVSLYGEDAPFTPPGAPDAGATVGLLGLGLLGLGMIQRRIR